jgi:transcriptional regulator
MKTKSEHRGDKHHASKVTERQIEQMKRLREQGWKAAEVAREYGICPDTVYRLTTGRGRIRA